MSNPFYDLESVIGDNNKIVHYENDGVLVRLNPLKGREKQGPYVIIFLKYKNNNPDTINNLLPKREGFKAEKAYQSLSQLVSQDVKDIIPTIVYEDREVKGEKLKQHLLTYLSKRHPQPEN